MPLQGRRQTVVLAGLADPLQEQARLRQARQADHTMNLEPAIERLAYLLAVAEEDLQVRGYVEPARVVDTTGRYILLDACTALVNGLAALSAATTTVDTRGDTP